MVAGGSGLSQLADANLIHSSHALPVFTYAFMVVVMLLSASLFYHKGSRQSILRKWQQEMDRQSSSIKSLHLRLNMSMQNYEELSSQFVQLQMQVTANTESQKLLQHLTGVLHELRGHLQVSVESQELMRQQAAGFAKLKAQVNMNQSAQQELKRQADEINELRERLVSSDESIMHMALTQKALAQKAHMLEEQGPSMSPFAIWAASQSKLELELSEQGNISNDTKSEVKEEAMTRTVSAETDPALEQSEDASAAGSLTSPALTRASWVQGLSLIAAHPNRVVSPAPGVTASCASLTRMRPRNRKGAQLNPTLPGSPCQNDSGRSDCSFDSKGAGPVAQPRQQSTNSRMSVGGAPNFDIQRLRTQSPFAMDFAVDAAKPSEIIDSQVLVMEETQPVALHQPNKGTKDSKS